jgi:geranylgeranyl diphosphate synthase, type II
MAEPALAVRPQVVPAEPALRAELRARVQEWGRRAALVPPLDIAVLRALAARASRELGVAAEHVDFVTVLLGNAAWEDTLGAVPLDRRLLLLPRCLRAPDQCRAPLDELGLACLRCGACPIGELEAEAEGLGYNVLVAEGTTAAARLVSSGRVQAIVAVACLHSLERSFDAATEGAVPALAIPLLGGGCSGTRVDLDWVREGLRARRPDRRFWHFDLERLRQRVEGWFDHDALKGLLCEEGAKDEALACDVIARGGKRWRPTLAAAVRQALCESDAPPPETVRRVAVAVECFHKASLVHDDIEDGDLVRNDQPALHASHGLAIALNVGDLLIGEGYRLIAEAQFPGDVRARMLRAVARAQRELCLGQGEELRWSREPHSLSRERALRMLQRKTGPAFEVGLLLGALAAEADEHTCAALSALSASLGLAYQIRDDIQDEDGASEGRPRSPLFVALAGERFGSPLDLAYARGQLAEDECLRVREAVKPDAAELFDEYRGASVRALRSLTHQPLKGLLFRLVFLFLGGARAGSSDGR